MEDQPIYPPKPEIQVEEKETNWGKTVFSILLFILGFYLIFGMSLETVIVLAAVVLVHELGHFLSMRAFGYKNVRMVFLPFMGAYTAGQKEEVPYRQEVLTLLAGPLPGIIAGMIMLPFISTEGDDLFTTATFMLLGINLFNMVPVMPLDGGRIFDRLFTRSRLVIRVVFMSLVLLGLLAYQLLSNEIDFFVLLIGFVLINHLIRTVQLIRSQKALKAEGLNPDQSYKELSDREYWQFAKFIKNRLRTQMDELIVMMRVRELLNHTSTNRLGPGEKILFFFTWLFFLIAPIVEYLLLIPGKMDI